MLQGEALFALAALVRTICRMEQQVGIEAVFVGKALATVDTHVWSLPCMHSGMSGQMVFQQERFSTLVTGIGTFFRRGRILIVRFIWLLDVLQLGRNTQPRLQFTVRRRSRL